MLKIKQTVAFSSQRE